MPLSLGPPPSPIESSRPDKQKIDAGSLLAEREEFMARNSIRRNVNNTCAKPASDKHKRVQFEIKDEHKESTATDIKHDEGHEEGAYKQFPWIELYCVMIPIAIAVIVLVCMRQFRFMCG